MGAVGGAVLMVVDFNDRILIPRGDVGDFAVVACDQFAADAGYWAALERSLPAHSALELVLPECFLHEARTRIPAISQAAKQMPKDRFCEYSGAVYVTRTTAYGRTRHGVVASVDLSDYEYKRGNTALIRASERTIEERIPPRVEIREALDIELPHIMLLVDDPEDRLMGACRNAQKRTVYDGELKGNGGHIKGELIEQTSELYAATEHIIASSAKRFGTKLFALVGDGNHSLATAKYCAEHNPTPYNGRALVEIVNVYDDGLVFEPIHRLVKTDDVERFVCELRAGIKGEAETAMYAPDPVKISVPSDKIEAINAIDAFCEDYVKRNGGYIEYVHGADALKKQGHAGIEMRGILKSELFGYVLENGVLPKKTFSLGEAEEKRYYVEARRIK